MLRTECQSEQPNGITHLEARLGDIDAAAHWADVVAREIAAARRRARVRWLRLPLAAALALCLCLAGAAWPVAAGAFVAAYGIVGAATGIRRWWYADDLSKLENPIAVNALALSYRDGGAIDRRLARDGLLALLPKLKPHHAERVEPEAMGALADILGGPPTDVELHLAIVRALQQVGDARAVPAVRRWAAPASTQTVGGRLADRLRGGPAGHASLDALREAAADCLPLLEARAERQRARDTLLRPAESPRTGALLRPAATGASVQAEQLLRPADRDDGR